MPTKLANFERFTPRWLHLWAIATVLVTLVLLVLGQLVTSFKVGMSDPIWPTEPWYLFVVGWQEPNRGYLIEHSHRIAGWTVGILSAVLAFGLWFGEPNTWLRRAGLIGLFVLLAGYGQFHGDLRAQKESAEVTWPTVSIAIMAVGLVVTGTSVAGAMLSGSRGAGVRSLGVVALVAVMIQGLLGGFRVRLDALFGPELAPIHGIFGQVVFCLLVSLAVLTRRTATSELPESSRRTLSRASFALVAVLFVQLIWGAMVRHRPDSLNQRLHLLTAFVAVGIAVWLIRAGLQLAKPRVQVVAHILSALLLLQVTLGVEAWMGKFGEEARSGKSLAAYLPEAESISVKQAAMRTAHTLVGTGVLAVAVMFALRVRAKTSHSGIEDSNEASWERAIAPEPGFALTGKRI